MNIEKGRTGTITVTVTGINNWTGLKARLYAAEKYEDVAIIDLEGTIAPEANKITFDYAADITSGLLLKPLQYEVVVYSDDKTFVKTVNKGQLIIEDVVKVTP